MAKKIEAYIKLQIPAGKANPSPPVGPALGQKGVNIMGFCKEFNAATQGLEAGAITPVVITVYSDKSFTFVIKSEPAPRQILKALGIPKGSSRPNTVKVGTLTLDQVIKIAKSKAGDLTAADLDAAIKTIAGTARSMGVIVEGLE